MTFVTDVDPSDMDSVVAVDLGYSSNSPSCGLHTDLADKAEEELHFGDCVDSTVRLIRENKRIDILLIVEAPLSVAHDESGNPAIRGDFEEGRGWYYGPGATVFAGAVRFVQRLGEELDPGEPIPLAEAFLSFKDGPTPDAEDAKEIHKGITERPEDSRAEFYVELVEKDLMEPIHGSIEGIPRVYEFEEKGC